MNIVKYIALGWMFFWISSAWGEYDKIINESETVFFKMYDDYMSKIENKLKENSIFQVRPDLDALAKIGDDDVREIFSSNKDLIKDLDGAYVLSRYPIDILVLKKITEESINELRRLRIEELVNGCSIVFVSIQEKDSFGVMFVPQ